MYNFKNDYCVVGHKAILNRLLELKDEVNDGYGLDKHSVNASNLIKKYLECENVDIHFMVGGTSANKTFLAHALKPYEAVVACETAHIVVHETGTIEANGHKIILLPSHNGKLDPEDLENELSKYIDEHMVKPKVVYISNSTETGTIYFKDELELLYKICKKHNMYLYIDGARLGTALTSFINDVEFKDLVNLCDAFYIGGTKNGALLGEAMVIVNDSLKEDFRYSIKQNGGMYSKGFINAIQFEVLFEDNLYFDLAQKANICAYLLKEGLEDLEIKLASPLCTNQVFIELKNEIVEKLSKIASFELWNKGKETSVIRLVTSFVTKEEDICNFLLDLRDLL